MFRSKCMKLLMLLNEADVSMEVEEYLSTL